MQEGFFKERGIYYRYNEFNPERLTLFFVHGVSGSSSAWLPYEPAFEKDYNVLSLDLRGHGKSIRLEKYEDYTIEGFSDDLYKLLEHCGIEKCVLISNSFGALIALNFLGKHEDMVLSTIFISPHFAVGKMRQAQFIKPMLMFLVKLRPKFSSKNKKGKHVDYSKYVNTGDWNVKRTMADVGNTGLESYLYSVAQTYEFNGEEILRSIKVPTLIIHGAKDTIFPLKYAIMMAGEIKDAKLVVLEDVDHIIVLNRVKRVIGVISEFLEKLK